MSTLAAFAHYEHPFDVMQKALSERLSGNPCALAVITNAEGGAVRAPGAMMLIGDDTTSYGYLSGGCIDSDVCLRASQSLTTGKAEYLRYGQGSPFLDIRLPCGGAIELSILPFPDIAELQKAVETLQARRAVEIAIERGEFCVTSSAKTARQSFIIRPKLSLRIAGRGIEPVALARLASAGGINVEVWSPDTECFQLVSCIPHTKTRSLTSPANLPEAKDDVDTAFVLLFHDEEWEHALLKNALSGPAFYIGAVGSKKTHHRRCQNLKDAGVTDRNIDRIRGPIGLIPSMRNASTLAISTLAEIVDLYRGRSEQI